MKVKLLNDNCLNSMKRIEDNSIDLILTDIPYGKVTREDNGLRSLDKEVADVETFNLKLFLDECYRISKGATIIFCGHEQYSQIYDYFNTRKKYGTVRGICWHKTNPSPMNGQYIYLNSFELAVWFKKKGSTYNGFCKHNLINTSTGSSKLHPTQKNLDLFKELILDNSKEGDVVFDPCMGSATTGVACINTNRNFIGIELDNTYFETCKNRINSHIITNNLQDINIEIA